VERREAGKNENPMEKRKKNVNTYIALFQNGNRQNGTWTKWYLRHPGTTLVEMTKKLENLRDTDRNSTRNLPKNPQNLHKNRTCKEPSCPSTICLVSQHTLSFYAGCLVTKDKTE